MGINVYLYLVPTDSPVMGSEVAVVFLSSEGETLGGFSAALASVAVKSLGVLPRSSMAAVSPDTSGLDVK